MSLLNQLRLTVKVLSLLEVQIASNYRTGISVGNPAWGPFVQRIIRPTISASPYDVFNPVNVAKLLVQRSWISLITLPSIRGWVETILLFFVVAVPAYFITTSFGWYNKPPVSDPYIWWLKFKGAFVAPALIEEMIMRVWVVPHKTEQVTKKWRYWVIFGALVIFVLLHPLNGIVNGGKLGEIFLRPEFILLVTLLGAVTHLSYQRTGSVWAPTLIHALIVGAWGIMRG